MGLINKTVTLKWNPKNKKWYESKGYIFTKWKDEFNVKIDDLQQRSTVMVDVECDLCKCKKKIAFYNYNISYEKYGFYYCNKCLLKTVGQNKFLKTVLNYSLSFEEWCIENNRQDILERWNYELNFYKPNEICFNSHKNIWFKCPLEIHSSELKNINRFTNGQEGSICCKACNSFAQWGIDHICQDFLEKYWDYEKNTNVNPWDVEYGSQKYVYIICQNKNYHGSYKIQIKNFTLQNQRCPYCANNSCKVHMLDSLGSLYPEVLDIWSNKNKKSPFEYTSRSSQKVWWKCENYKHDDYPRSISNSYLYKFQCPNCIREREESFLQEKVRLYLNKLGFIILHEHSCTLKCINPKTKHILPYDNEIQDLKLIIEVHGQQHYLLNAYSGIWKSKSKTPEEAFHYQKIKDRYKRIFAKKQGYFYLEIPYWTDDKNDTWKTLINNKIKEIVNGGIINE